MAHVAACCKSSNYLKDIGLTENNMQHKATYDKCTIDGAGNVRAYYHLISCNSYCLVVTNLKFM